MSTRNDQGLAPCGRCGLARDASTWRELELVERIAPEQVREILTAWPDRAVIEVRRCVCGQVMARKSIGPSRAGREARSLT